MAMFNTYVSLPEGNPFLPNHMAKITPTCAWFQVSKISPDVGQIGVPQAPG